TLVSQRVALAPPRLSLHDALPISSARVIHGRPTHEIELGVRDAALDVTTSGEPRGQLQGETPMTSNVVQDVVVAPNENWSSVLRSEEHTSELQSRVELVFRRLHQK